MTGKSKKYLFTLESREVFILRCNKTETVRGYCAECQTEVEMLTLDAITTQTNTPTRELIRLIENNLLHSIEMPSGNLLVCQNSLKAIGQGKSKK